MINHMKKATLITPTFSFNEFNEEIKTGETTKPIKIIISFLNGNSNIQTNVKTVNSEYIGIVSKREEITEKNQVLCDNRLYKIDFVSNLSRKTILYLTLIKQYE